jgi:hypothetical protein
MAQQTAVEWLVEQFKKTFSEYIKLNPDWEVIEQAKAMEKEQIMNAYIDGEHQQGFEGEAEQYYNETYQSNKD